MAVQRVLDPALKEGPSFNESRFRKGLRPEPPRPCERIVRLDTKPPVELHDGLDIAALKANNNVTIGENQSGGVVIQTRFARITTDAQTDRIVFRKDRDRDGTIRLIVINKPEGTSGEHV